MRLSLTRSVGVLLALVTALVAGLGIRALVLHRDRIVVEPRPIVLPADGRAHGALKVSRRSGGVLSAGEVESSGVGVRLVEAGGGLEGLVQAPVMPSKGEIRLRWRGRSVTVPVTFVFDPADSYGDGTPDFLRLHGAEDRRDFRSWFTMLAERAAQLPAARLPAEISDCSALLRYAYREALVRHDEAWILAQGQEGGFAVPSVRQYQYPETPLGAALFRVRPGAFVADDLKDGGFAQFADARTLMTLNTHFVSRRVGTARPGDLFFYRQLEQNSQYHSMIVAGRDADAVVYHTGPVGAAKGEMRLVSIEDLMHHPDARWRPLPENSNFLGVYRWNILRDPD